MTGSEKVLSVGEVAKRSGVSISTLHFYESKGLIHSSRNAGNHRRYSRQVLRKIAVVKAAQLAGIPLKEIADALATIPDTDKVSAKDWERLSSEWKKDLDDRIERMILLRDTLSYCIGCGCLSVDYCKMINPDDQLAERGAGARLLEPEDAAEMRAQWEDRMAENGGIPPWEEKGPDEDG